MPFLAIIEINIKCKRFKNWAKPLLPAAAAWG